MTNRPDLPETDPAALMQTLGEIAAQSQRLMLDFWTRQASNTTPVTDPLADPVGVNAAFSELAEQATRDPAPLMRAGFEAWRSYTELWTGAAQSMWGLPVESPVTPAENDRRFQHADWVGNPVFAFIKESYLIAARTVVKAVGEVQGLDAQTAAKVDFFTRQFVDALAPTNFVLTNPEVIHATIESGGQNLLRGLQNLLRDLEQGDGELRVTMSDPEAFVLGENIATTPGKVVYQNELLQLIQYAPTTEQVYENPVLIVPPWINKYYVLDLRPKNSFIKWLVEQGHTVFVIAWVNPDTDLANKTFDDYLVDGPLAALDAIEAATGAKQINVLGYCIGGTLIGAMLAYMAATDDKRVASATFLTSMLDFSEPGDLGVFIDEQQLEHLDGLMEEKGYLDGKSMAATFNMLRANDLIWAFVIWNYLLGKDPFPMDLFYWNSDSTRMPVAMHRFYLRKMYLENVFKDPDGIELAGVPIDLRAISVPTYFLSTIEDHIAPWRSTYAGACLVSGPVRFVLGKSGHIAGVINPPAANKYGYFTGGEVGPAAEDWLSMANEESGSWWGDWAEWLIPFGGAQVAARQPGEGDLEVLEDAPGSYAKVRLG